MASSGNFATINFQAQSLISTVTPTLGNLKFDGSTLSPGNYNGGVVCNFGMKSGKWYWEIYLSGGGTPQGGRDWSVGFAPYETCSKTTDEGTYGQDLGNGSSATLSGYSFTHVNGSATGIRHNNSTDTSAGLADHTSGDVLGFALDLDNGTWIIYRNGSSLGTVATGIDTSLTYFAAVGASGGTISAFDVTCNFGQDSTFGGAITAGGNADGNGFGDFKYSVPSGYLACCSGNLEISSDIDPAQTDDDYPQKQFNAVTWTGDATNSRSISVGFQPDFIWFKSRSSAFSHRLYDTSRGINSTGGKRLFSNSDGAEVDQTSGQDISAVGSDGFTTGASANIYTNDTNDGGNHVAWCWRANGGVTSSNTDGSITTTTQANTKAGFSIITYTGTGSNATIGHGLSSAPDFVLVKRRSSAQTWAVYHSALGGTYNLVLNGTNAKATGSAFWQDTDTDNNVITIGTEGRVNQNGGTYVAYAWHNVEGYSSFGSFEGNSNADGPMIVTNFRPRLVICKAVDASENWQVRDTARSTFNADSQVRIYWNSNSAEGSASTASPIDFLSNGFKVRGSNSEINSNTIVYGAWGDVPFKYNNTF